MKVSISQVFLRVWKLHFSTWTLQHRGLPQSTFQHSPLSQRKKSYPGCRCDSGGIPCQWETRPSNLPVPESRPQSSKSFQNLPFTMQPTQTRFKCPFKSGQAHRYIQIEVVAQQRLRVARDGVCRGLVRVEHVVIDYEPHLPPGVALLKLLFLWSTYDVRCVAVQNIG